MLDTIVKHDSGLAKVCSSLKTLEESTCSVATQLSPELLRKEFVPRENWGFNILANFKTKWSLTGDQPYFKFANPNILSIKRFKDKVAWDINQTLVSNALLTTKKMTRLAMCNTFISLHI